MLSIFFKSLLGVIYIIYVEIKANLNILKNIFWLLKTFVSDDCNIFISFLSFILFISKENFGLKV